MHLDVSCAMLLESRSFVMRQLVIAVLPWGKGPQISKLAKLAYSPLLWFVLSQVRTLITGTLPAIRPFFFFVLQNSTLLTSPFHQEITCSPLFHRSFPNPNTVVCTTQIDCRSIASYYTAATISPLPKLRVRRPMARYPHLMRWLRPYQRYQEQNSRRPRTPTEPSAR